MIAAYIRVSSRSQDYAMQQAAIERAANARGEVIVEWYAEKRSGGVMERTEIRRVREAARKGEIRKLYVYRIDRLTRTGIRDTFEVIEELRSHGCALVSVNDNFSLEGPASEIILAVMAWAAKMERLAINERIASARERIEESGGKWGRPTVVVEESAAKIASMRAAGVALRTIARECGLSLSSVARFVKRNAKAVPAG